MYENTQNLHQLCDLYVRKNKAKFFLRPAIQYFNEIWPVRKKVWPPLVYTMVFLGPRAAVGQRVLLGNGHQTNLLSG